MAPSSRGTESSNEGRGIYSSLPLPTAVPTPSEASRPISSTPSPPKISESGASIKGFVGGTVSGLTKLAVGHPFDTIKVRMQCSPLGTYRGPLDCFLQLARKESLFGLYKGATPPALGWAITDSVLLGSLHNYRRLFSRFHNSNPDTADTRLPIKYHALAGLLAGWTNSLVTTPVELVKAKLQMQTQRVSLHLPGTSTSTTIPPSSTTSTSIGGGSASSSSATATAVVGKQQYSGPWDCVRQIVRQNGLRGMWHALPATLLFRSSFAAMFGSYEYFQQLFTSWRGSAWEMSPSSITFLSGGLAAEVFWLTAFPADVIKNRMMADNIQNPKYSSIKQAFDSVWNSKGPNAKLYQRINGFYTGFTPCLLRAFPTNAAALFAFETVMHLMNAEKV